MVELTLVFFLGALVAGLIWVLLLPAIWHRAVRLTRQRLERALPLDTNEILAERDRERAEFAVKTLMLDHRMEAMQAQVLAAKREVGERLAREATLIEGEHAAKAALEAQSRTHATLAAEHETLSKALASARAELDEARRALEQAANTQRTLDAQLCETREGLADATLSKAALQARLQAVEAAQAEEQARAQALRHELMAFQQAAREGERRAPDAGAAH